MCYSSCELQFFLEFLEFSYPVKSKNDIQFQAKHEELIKIRIHFSQFSNRSLSNSGFPYEGIIFQVIRTQ